MSDPFWDAFLDDWGVAARNRLARYFDKPAAFARDLIRWPEGRSLTAYQSEVLDSVPERKRVAVRGPHGLGKTTSAAVAVLWFSTTRDAAGIDWKIPTTASAWRQLTHYLWPEIHKWARLLDWDKLDRPPFDRRRELLERTLKLRFGEAFAVASDDPATIEGVHADQVLYIFDEAKTIPAGTWEAAEGAFSGAGADTEAEAFALAISTPGEPSGVFYNIHRRAPGLEDWWVRHVKLDEAIAAKRVSKEWAEQRARQWGRKSAVYLNRVEGEFASSDEDAVIALAWVEAANARWRERFGDHTEDFDTNGLGPLTAVGVDVGHTGPDPTVLAARYGNVVAPLRRHPKISTTETTGYVQGVLRVSPDAHATVDVVGIGAGVVDNLRDADDNVVAFSAGSRCNYVDRSGELGFVDVRAAAWWWMRELLDPENNYDVALPPDDLLTGDLTAPHWRVMAGGKIRVESKDDIRKRIGRSTDSGDAVVQAFWIPEADPQVGVVTYEDRVEISRY